MHLNPNKSGSRRHDGLVHLHRVSGVYIIWKNKQVYIGSTRDLRTRLRYHSRRFAGWEYAYLRYPIAEARNEEARLIRKYIEKGFRFLNTRLEKSVGRHPTVSRACYFNRIRMGWDPERARTTPKKGT